MTPSLRSTWRATAPTSPQPHRRRAARSSCPPTRSNTGSSGTRRARQPAPGRCPAYRNGAAARGGPDRRTRRARRCRADDDRTVGALTQLAAQHNQQRSAQSIADARYEIAWEKAASYGFGDRTDRGAGLAADRRRCGNRCAPCRPADGARAPAPDPGHAWYRTPTKRSSRPRSAPPRPSTPRCASCIWAVSTRTVRRRRARWIGCSTASWVERERIIRAALAAELEAPIWLVTRGAQRVTRADIVSPVQSMTVGLRPHRLLRTSPTVGWARGHGCGRRRRLVRVGRPHPRRAGGRRSGRARELASPYFARVSRRLTQPTTAPLELRREATYLVTGGLGAVGLELAEYLAAHGARQLVLTGRRPPGESRVCDASKRYANSTAARSWFSRQTSPTQLTSRECWLPSGRNCRHWSASCMPRVSSDPPRCST